MRKQILFAVLLFLLSTLFIISCQKENKELIKQEEIKQEEIASKAKNEKEHGHLKQTKTFSSDVVIQWLNMQLNMLRVPLAGHRLSGC